MGLTSLVEIALDIESESNGLFRFRHGTLYPILHRLEADGLLYYVMPLIDGRSVAGLISTGGPMPPERAMAMGIDLLPTVLDILQLPAPADRP